METRPYVSWELMNNFLIDAFKGYGVPEEDAKIVADVLLESDRRGIESHGCNRFKPIYINRIMNGTLLPVTEMEIIKGNLAIGSAAAKNPTSSKVKNLPITIVQIL